MKRIGELLLYRKKRLKNTTSKNSPMGKIAYKYQMSLFKGELWLSA